MVTSTTRMRGGAWLESDGVIDHGEDGVGDDDEDDPRHHRGGRGQSHRGRAAPGLHAAHAAGDGDEHAEDYTFDHARGEIRERGGAPRMVPVRDDPDL